MDKKIIKGLGIGAMCLAGAVGLTGCNTNNTDDVKIVSIDVLEETIPASVEAGDFDESNIVLLVKYSDNTEKRIYLTEEYVRDAYKSKLYQTGEHTILIDYNGFTDTLNINVTMTETAIAEKFQNALKYAMEHDSVITNKYFASDLQNDVIITFYHRYNSLKDEVEVYVEYEYDKEYEDDSISKVKESMYLTPTEWLTWDSDGTFEHQLFDDMEDYANYVYTFGEASIYDIAMSGSGFYNAKYSGEIVDGQLVYTAKFTQTGSRSTIECVFKFTEDKLLTAKETFTGINEEGESEIEGEEFEYNYQTVTDAQMHKADVTSKKSAFASEIADLNSTTTLMKGRDFTLTVSDANGGNSTTYTHTANSDVLTSSSGTLNFTYLFPTITTYGSISYDTTKSLLSVSIPSGFYQYVMAGGGVEVGSVKNDLVDLYFTITY